MKINRLTESKKLYEADTEEKLADINPSEDSAEEIANALQNTIETASNGTATLSDTNAVAAANELKTTAQDLGASEIAMIPEVGEGIPSWDTLGVENELTKKLDRAYKTHLKNPKDNANVLITGLPGSGKTSAVKDWANNHNPKIHLFEVNVCDPELEKSIYGLDLRDMNSEDRNKLTKQYGKFLDQLDEKNTVLFLDEFNRGKDAVRRAMMDLVLFRESPDMSKPNGKRYFPNLLFTVACQNPSGMRTDKQASELSDAEKDRFALKMINSFDSTRERSLEFFTKYYNKHIDELVEKYKNDKNNSTFLAELEELLKMRYLMLYLFNDASFKYLSGDNAKDLEIINRLSDKKQTLLTQRGITDMAKLTPTYKEDLDCNNYAEAFLETIKDNMPLRPEDLTMIENILASYTEPSFDWLVKNYFGKNSEIVPVAAADNKEQNSQNSTENPEEAPKDLDAEDDDDLFRNTGADAAVLNSHASVGTTSGMVNTMLDRLSNFMQ